VWYHDGDTADANQRVATYTYDPLFRRIRKDVANMGDGVVNKSDASGMTGIQAGDRTEHYYYAGWRLAEPAAVA
jgi:hypothetical protein